MNILINKSPYNGMLLVLNKFRSQLVTFLSEAEAAAAIAEIRPAAPIIYLYGESQIGKSGLMNAIAFTIGKNNGFPVEQENFHYMSIGDKYDSGYTGLKTVIFQDDCAAEHQKFRDATNVTSDIKHSNTVTYYSVQADIVGKGKIPFRHYLKIKSGNTKDGGILSDLSFPLAGTNRINFFEVVLKKEYADQQGRFKGNTDGDYLDPNIHLIRPYFFENASNKDGISKISIRYGEFMSTPQFLKHVDQLYKDKMKSGKKYVKQINNMRDLEICPKCSLFKAPGYCACQSIENQAGIADVANLCMNTFMVQVLAYMPDLRAEMFEPWLYRRIHRVIDGMSINVTNLVLRLLHLVTGTHLLLSWFFLPLMLNTLMWFKLEFSYKEYSFGALLFTFWKIPMPIPFFTNGFTTTLNIYSQVGLVTLMGLIARNGILVVEFANKLQEEGKAKLDAIREA